MIKEFFFGLTFPLKSIKLFFIKPKILLYSIVPLIINALIYGTIFILTFRFLIRSAAGFTGVYADDAGLLNELLNYILIAFSFLGLLLICYFIFITVGGIISAPFNESISQIVEKFVTGSKEIISKGFFTDAKESIKAESVKLFFYLIFAVPLFLLGFVPGVGILFLTAGVIFSIFYNSLDFIDYPMTRRYFSFKQKLNIILSKKPVTFGFGAIAFAIMFLPIINVILKPMLVVSGTVLYFEKFHNQS